MSNYFLNFIAHCPQLNNGTFQCSNGTIADRGTHCTFCAILDTSYKDPTMGHDYAWSEGTAVCEVSNCSTTPPLDNSQVHSSCDRQYQSICTTVCGDGYVGQEGSYICDVIQVDSSLVWKGSTHCEQG